MGRLPNSEQAILDVRKIADYCLSLAHPRGRHKARIFRETLGIDRSDAQWLRNLFLAAIRGSEAVEDQTDAFGSRWRVDVRIARQNKAVMVRTVWIVRSGENTPRFVTCWVL